MNECDGNDGGSGGDYGDGGFAQFSPLFVKDMSRYCSDSVVKSEKSSFIAFCASSLFVNK